MKNHFWSFLLITWLLVGLQYGAIAQANSTWNKKNASEWFDTLEWLTTKAKETKVEYEAFGRAMEQSPPDTSNTKVTYLDFRKLKPHASIDKVEFAKQYHAHPAWWDAAFSFLQTTDLAQIKPGKYFIEGDNVYATVTEGPARKEDTTLWESHHNYIDIHYVVQGQEKIGVAPVSSAKVVKEYDPARDIVFYTAKGAYYKADPGTFFIFFPKDAHRPNLQLNGNDLVKKVVVKVRSTAGE
ncbi:MAG: YhcH/YjgK/YiaL family protein [Flavisolibacter sp.]|nr:YhcH/YjgK/YiaL family protein [Flavisolibacter sp.]